MEAFLGRSLDIINETQDDPESQETISANQILCMDIWLKIFANFPLRDVVRLRLVCSSWNEMLTKHVLIPRKELMVCLVHYSTNKYFRKQHISDCYYVSNYRQLLPLLENHQKLLQRLTVFNFLLGNWFLQIPFVNLKSVSFIDCTFSICFNSLANYLHNITTLEIINSEITDEQVRIIAPNLPMIEHFNLSLNSSLTGAHLGTLNSTIKSLNLSNCFRLNDYKLCYSLQELLTKGGELESLRLKPLTSSNNYLPVTGFFVVTTLRRLKMLKLDCIPDLALIEASKPETATLEQLTLYGRPTHANDDRRGLYGDHFLFWLFAFEYSQMRRLNLIDFSYKHASDDGILRSLRACPNLTHLKLKNLPFLTLKSLDHIIKLERLKCVKFIDVNLTDEIVINILQRCNHLNNLVIDFTDNSFAKPYRLTEAIIHECIYLCQKFPNRNLKVVISKSLLPTHKLFTIPKNLSLEILRSRFLIRKRAIYVDDPERE